LFKDAGFEAHADIIHTENTPINREYDIIFIPESRLFHLYKFYSIICDISVGIKFGITRSSTVRSAELTSEVSA